MRPLVVVALLWAAAVRAESWPVELADPAAARGDPADLVLPMPCGAAMAFQKVTVPVEAADPLADRRLRLGQPVAATGYADDLRTTFLRGPFEEGGATHYYIARYEMTEGQWRALHGDCSAPTRRDRLAKGGLSWFDAVDAARLYTEWLLANAPERMPRADGAAGFFRLPTGDEWEYAARGGARVDDARFAERTYFGAGDMREHALFQTPGSGRGRLGPVGLRKPNPLGLFDVYGNAEELVFEPFRLNAAGRLHGQAGGVVTRGGSVLSSGDQLFSAQRTEYPPFDGRGVPTRSATFGVRLVISAPVVTSDARLAVIRDRWKALTERAGGKGGAADPDLLLSTLIAAEPDPRRKAALGAIQLELRRDRDRAQTARMQSARATLLAGAMFVRALRDTADRIAARQESIRMLVAFQRAGRASDVLRRQMRAHVRQLEAFRRRQSGYLLSYRAALETLSTETTPEERQTAHDVLREELSLSGRPSERDMLDSFWRDLGVYAARPDMGREALLSLALD